MMLKVKTSCECTSENEHKPVVTLKQITMGTHTNSSHNDKTLCISHSGMQRSTFKVDKRYFVSRE